MLDFGDRKITSETRNGRKLLWETVGAFGSSFGSHSGAPNRPFLAGTSTEIGRHYPKLAATGMRLTWRPGPQNQGPDSGAQISRPLGLPKESRKSGNFKISKSEQNWPLRARLGESGGGEVPDWPSSGAIPSGNKRFRPKQAASEIGPLWRPGTQ